MLESPCWKFLLLQRDTVLSFALPTTSILSEYATTGSTTQCGDSSTGPQLVPSATSSGVESQYRVFSRSGVRPCRSRLYIWVGRKISGSHLSGICESKRICPPATSSFPLRGNLAKTYPLDMCLDARPPTTLPTFRSGQRLS